MTGTRYTALDGLRGIAAFAVLLHHAHPIFGRDPAPNAYLAVDLFFALSGFVIANAYEKKLQEGLSWSYFLISRIVRLYPLYLLGVGIGIFAEMARQILGSSETSLLHAAASTILNLLFLPIPTPEDTILYPLNLPAWSLMCELLVNAAYAFVAIWLRTRYLVTILIISGVILTILVLLFGANHGFHAFDALIGITRCVFSFSLGVLLWRTRPQLPSLPSWTLGVTLLAILLFPVSGGITDLAFIFVLSPALIVLGSNSRHVSRFDEISGASSYPIYAIHFPILALAAGAGTVLHLPLPLIGVVTIVGICLASVPLQAADEQLRRRLSLKLGLRASTAPVAVHGETNRVSAESNARLG